MTTPNHQAVVKGVSVVAQLTGNGTAVTLIVSSRAQGTVPTHPKFDIAPLLNGGMTERNALKFVCDIAGAAISDAMP